MAIGAATVSQLQGVASGTVVYQATSAAAVPGVTAAAQGYEFYGFGAALIPELSLSSSSTIVYQASSVSDLPVFAAVGGLPVSAEGAAQLGLLESAGTAALKYSGTVGATLPSINGSGAAQSVSRSSGSVTVSEMSAGIAGTVAYPAEVACNLPEFAAAATLPASSNGDGELPIFGSAAHAVFGRSATVVADLPIFSADAVGRGALPAAVGVILPEASAYLSATVVYQTQGKPEIPSFTAAGELPLIGYATGGIGEFSAAGIARDIIYARASAFLPLMLSSGIVPDTSRAQVTLPNFVGIKSRAHAHRPKSKYEIEAYV